MGDFQFVFNPFACAATTAFSLGIIHINEPPDPEAKYVFPSIHHRYP